MNESPWPLFGVHTAEAEIYAEAMLVRDNLQRALRAVEFCIARFKEPNESMAAEDALVQNCMISNAICLVMSCFEGKRRYHLDSGIYKDMQGGLEYFENIKDIRDSYVSHTFGPMRQSAFGIFMDENFTVMGNGELIMVHNAYDKEMYNNLGLFIATAGKYVEKELPKLKEAAVISAIRLSIEERKGLKELKAVVPGKGELTKGRSAYRAMKNKT